MANRVKEIRTRRGLTVSALADLVGMSHTHISRIENGLRGLSIPVAERLAKAMNTTVSDVLGVNGVSGSSPSGHSGIREDAEPYEPTSSDPIPLRPVRGQNIDPWRIKTNALDRAGIKKGMIVFVDISAPTVEGVQALQCVVAQIYAGNGDGATTVLRQFVPPGLLITNSSEQNELPLDVEKGEAYIKGVIVGKYEGM